MPHNFQPNWFKGVFTIMPTPFSDDGSLDTDSLDRLTRFLIDLEVDGVVVLGVMGEAPKLSTDEEQAVIRTTVKAAAGRIPVFAGTSSGGTDLTIAKSHTALELGAAGLLVAPPGVQSDAVIAEAYRRLDEAVDAPIILHDYPATTGIKLSAELVVELHRDLEHVKVIKLEEPPTGPKISAIRKLGSDIGIVGGLGGMFYLEELLRGADGMMTGFSYPEVLVSIQRAFNRGDRSEAARIFYQACPILRYEFQPGVGLALRKEVYRQRGAITSAFVRHPGPQIDEQLISELNSALEASDLGMVTS